MLGERPGVLVAAAGAEWEVEALRVLADGRARAVLLKRCVDLADLLATAATGQARVAVVSAGLIGLDADSVRRLGDSGMAVVVVSDAVRDVGVPSLPRVFETVRTEDVGTLASVLPAAAAAAVAQEHALTGSRAGSRAAPPAFPERTPGARTSEAAPTPDPVEAPGRIVAVWGPTGAPGRTTVAVALAAEMARRGEETMLLDADCHGGAVAQHLGVLDEVSGLLAAVRLANAGQLDAGRLASAARGLEPGLRVLTGLPRPDRWVEVRAAAFDALLETSRAVCSWVVVDLGFDLGQEPQGFPAGAPRRNQMTLTGLDLADEVVVVGSADPVGLARLARGLVALREHVPTAAVHVVVNRMRPSLAWGEQDVRAMVEGFVVPASLHFLPDDVAGVDRAMVEGRPVSAGSTALARAVAQLGDELHGEDSANATRARRVLRLRRRRAGRGR